MTLEHRGDALAPDSQVLRRILRECESDDIFALLSKQLPPTDLQSLLLEVYRRRVVDVSAPALLASYERNPLVRPSKTNPVSLLAIDRLAFDLSAPRFEPLQLSPLCPLGTNAAIAPVDQNQTVTTIRNAELVSDSTNVLALECAVRRRECLRSSDRLRERVRLCASHRLLRPQATQRPGSYLHFHYFAMCTAGRNEGDYRFELDALTEQLALCLELIGLLDASAYAVRGVRVSVADLTDGRRRKTLAERLVAPLSERFVGVDWDFDPHGSGRQYYVGVRFSVRATDDAGAEHTVADGGFTRWTQQLLSDEKERLLIGGIGTERLCTLFRRRVSTAHDS